MMNKITVFILTVMISCYSYAYHYPREHYFPREQGSLTFDGKFAEEDLSNYMDLNVNGSRLAIVNSVKNKLQIIDLTSSRGRNLSIVESYDLPDFQGKISCNELFWLHDENYIVMNMLHEPKNGRRYRKVLLVDRLQKQVKELMGGDDDLEVVSLSKKHPNRIAISRIQSYKPFDKKIDWLKDEISLLHDRSNQVMQTYYDQKDEEIRIELLSMVAEITDEIALKNQQTIDIYKQMTSGYEKLSSSLWMYDIVADGWLVIEDDIPFANSSFYMDDDFKLHYILEVKKTLNSMGKKVNISEKNDEGLFVPIFSISNLESMDKKFLDVSPDLSTIFYTKTTRKGNFREVFAYNIEEDTHSKVNLGDSIQADVKGVVLDIFDGSRKILGYTTSKLFYQAHSLDARVDKLVNSINCFVKSSHNVGILSKDKNRIFVQNNPMSSPAEFLLYEVDSDTKLTEITLFEETLGKNCVLAPMEGRMMKARDGLDLTAYITKPQGAGDGAYPFLVLPHGGPRCRNSYKYSRESQFWADRGIGTIQINFRGSSGHGKKFQQAGNGEWGKKMLDDVEDVVLQLIDEGLVDPDKLGIAGYSYGGYMVYAALAYKPDLFKVGVAGAGDCDLVQAIEDTHSAEDRLFWEVLMGGKLSNKYGVAHLKECSPLHFAGNIKVPLCIIHGEEDQIVHYNQAQLMYDELNRVGNNNFVAFKINKQGHGFSKSENVHAMFAIIEDVVMDAFGMRDQAEPLGDALERAPDFEMVW
jgi:dienelactone hydrolase